MNTERNTPVKLTLGQAAKESGYSKTSISNALKSGKLSYIDKSDAGYQIDPSELFRVFPPKGSGNSSENALVDDSEHLEITDLTPDIQLVAELETIKRELELTNQKLREKEEAAQKRERELENDRSHWRNQAESHMRLLEDHSKKAESEAERLRREREELRQEAQQREAKQAERVRELEEKLDNTPRTVWDMLFGKKG